MISFLSFLLFIIPSFQIDPSKISVAYFSIRGETYGLGKVPIGNNENIVDYIKNSYDNIDYFSVVVKNSYPEALDELITIGLEEKYSNTLPELMFDFNNLNNFDVIILLYPIWHNDLPNAVMSLLKKYNFSGKTIYPFATHEGSGFGNSIEQIKKLAYNSTIKEGFLLRGKEAREESSQPAIKKFLSDILDTPESESCYIKMSIFLLLYIFILF